jgi:hypothetical protein
VSTGVSLCGERDPATVDGGTTVSWATHRPPPGTTMDLARAPSTGSRAGWSKVKDPSWYQHMFKGGVARANSANASQVSRVNGTTCTLGILRAGRHAAFCPYALSAGGIGREAEAARSVPAESSPGSSGGTSANRKGSARTVPATRPRAWTRYPASGRVRAPIAIPGSSSEGACACPGQVPRRSIVRSSPGAG